MDIRQVRYFIAAAEEGHLGRAAERIYLSQPALSRQIQLLEAEIGAKLFVRTPRGVTLTQVGQTLLGDARQVEQMMVQTIERAQRFGQGSIGELDLGAFGTALFDFVPRLLALLRQTHVDVNVTLHHAPIEDLIAGLRQSRLLIVFERRVVQDADIVSNIAVQEPAYLAMSAANPLAQRQSIHIDLLRHEALVAGRELGRARGAREFCREHGFEPRIVSEARDMTSAALLVASGVGSCVVPSSLTHLQLPRVVYRPIEGSFDTSFPLYCYHRKNESSPLLATLLAAIAELKQQQAISSPASPST